MGASEYFNKMGFPLTGNASSSALALPTPPPLAPPSRGGGFLERGVIFLTMIAYEIGWLGVLLAVFAGAIRVGTPFLFVSLGECLTEKSGRINLGLEGTLVMGAMGGYALALRSGSPWLAVIGAAMIGAVFGLLHSWLCSFPKVNDIAIGIALMIFGTGLAFFLGTPYIQPSAPRLPSIELGWWSEISQLKAALQINALFLLGVGAAFLLDWTLKHTKWGLQVRIVGESADAGKAMGFSVVKIRSWSTAIGGAMAGIGGAYLSLYYPGSWSEGLSSGQGLMAVALVIFARWNPLNCLWAALLFGGSSALGPALQAVGVTSGYYLFNAVPYFLTLLVMILSSSSKRKLLGAPTELSLIR